MKIVLKLCTLLLIAGLGGCATINSQSASQTKADRKEAIGSYTLPKAVVPIEVWAGRSGLHIVAEQPILVPDPQHTYRLAYGPSFLSSDSFKLDVEAQTGFLKSSTAQIEGRALETFAALTPPGPKAESDPKAAKSAINSDGAIRLARILFDPEDPTAGLGELESAIAQFGTSSSYTALCQSNAKKPKKPMAICIDVKTFLANKVDLKTAPVSVFSPPLTPASDENNGTNSCNAGLCYRMNRIWLITLNAPGGEKVQAQFLAPNGAPIQSIDIGASVFVKRETKPIFERGMLKSNDVTKPSSAEKAAQLPFAAAKALFQAPAEVLQLRVNYESKSKDLINAEKERLKAEAEKIKAQSELEATRAADARPKSDTPLPAPPPEGKPAPETATAANEATPSPILAISSPFAEISIVAATQQMNAGDPGDRSKKTPTAPTANTGTVEPVK